MISRVDGSLAQLININDVEARVGGDKVAATFTRSVYLTIGRLVGAVVVGAAIGR
jgi:hypothetical protein